MESTIHTHRWYPDSSTEFNGRGVYILHGIGEHAGRHERLAQHLCQLGYTVGAHDHPGHGKSAGERGVISYSGELEIEAAKQLVEFKKEVNGEVILFGHSLGGLAAASMVLNHKVSVAGLILSAPALKPLISPWNKFKLGLLKYIAPGFSQQLPYEAEKLTSDATEQQKGTNDPLNHRYKSVGIVLWLIEIGQLTLSRAHLINVPMLMLVAGDDLVVDAQACLQFSAAVSDTLRTEHLYEGYRHEVLNETPVKRERVLADITHWLHHAELVR